MSESCGYAGCEQTCNSHSGPGAGCQAQTYKETDCAFTASLRGVPTAGVALETRGGDAGGSVQRE